MSEILNEIEETQTETENSNGSEILELPQRVNPLCVISKDAIKVEDVNGKKHDLHMIETNSSWGSNPYGEAYAIVPDTMVLDIMETQGYCDIKLNEDGTEVVEFTAREIPEIPTEEPGPTLEERVTTIEETLANGGTTGTDIWDEMAVAIEEGVNEV